MTELMEHAEKIPFNKEAVTESQCFEAPLFTSWKNHGQQVYIQSYRKEDMITFIPPEYGQGIILQTTFLLP